MDRSPISVVQALDDYYKEHIAVKAVAKRRAEYAIEALKKHFQQDLLRDIEIPACRIYALSRKVTDATIRRELGVLQAAANHALRWRRIALDKMPSIELPKAEETKPVWLFKDELEHLLEVAESQNERVWRFCQLAYHTGSRRAAIENLPWSRVSFGPNRIDLQDPDAPVTKKRRPIVPVSEAMADELSLMQSSATTDWVLGSNTSIARCFETVAAKAGLLELPRSGLRSEGRLTPHVLRHSRATHLLQEGKPPWAVANLLGDSLTTVMRVYGHACPNYLEDVLT